MVTSPAPISGGHPGPALLRNNGVTEQGVHWLVREGSDTLINADGAPDWFGLDRDSRATRVKDGLDRSTWLVQTEDAAVYVKCFIPTGWRARIRAIMLGSPAAREWRATSRAEELGVPAVRAIAVGDAGRWTGRSVLLLEEATHTTTLRDRWLSLVHLDDDSRRRDTAHLVAAVAKLMADAHVRGLVHRDLHPGNILIREAPGRNPEAMLVDLLGARAGRPPASIGDRARNLAQLDQFFHRLTSIRERLRFVLTYLRSLRTTAAIDPSMTLNREARDLLTLVAVASRSHRNTLARQRDARIRQDGKYFGRIDLTDGWTATVVLTLARQHAIPGPAVPDRTRQQWRELLQRAVKHNTTDVVADQVSAGSAGRGFRIEWTRARGPAEGLRWRLFGSPSRQRFEACHRLRHRDRPGELVLGHVERRSGCGVDVCGVLLPGLQD